MSLLEEITRTFLRWTNGRSAAPEETVFRPAGQRQVGAYRILERLGFGGMGHVYLALDTRLDRRVALKFLPPDLASDQALLQRLELEARTASALNHPNILTIYEIGEFAGERFIASEHIDGVTLRTALEQRAVDTGTAIDIASQVASALMAAHSAGIVHRDLKPGNIMIRPDGYVKVIDFGIAKHRTRSGGKHANLDLTTPGAIVGTLAYMSPEQARGEEVDARTDLWSLGVILFEMLARARPFDAPTETALIEAIQNDPIPPLPAAKSRAAAVDRILQSALAKNPARRYQTAGEMLADLQQLSQASGLSSRIRPVIVRRNPARQMAFRRSTAHHPHRRYGPMVVAARRKTAPSRPAFVPSRIGPSNHLQRPNHPRRPLARRQLSSIRHRRARRSASAVLQAGRFLHRRDENPSAQNLLRRTHIRA